MRIPFLSCIYIPHSPEYIVHFLSEGLILHKRTLAPIKPLMYGLRRYDKGRCAAVLDPDEAARQGHGAHEYEGNNIPSGRTWSYGAYSNKLGYVRGDGGKLRQLYI